MPFNFTCPYCFKKTLVEDAFAGQSGPCVNCGKTVTLPGQPPLRQAQAEASAARPSSSKLARVNPRLTAVLLKSAGWLVSVGLLSVLVIYLLWPSLQMIKSRRDRVTSLNNLQRIAEALQAYAGQYGTYPPPIVYDARGVAMHSWRVLILEQLGEAHLFARYRMDLPWDAPENQQLFAAGPSVYTNPAAGIWANQGETNYALLVGAGTMFPSSGPLRPADIADGLANTLLVVETTHPGVEWTRPWDLNVSQLNTNLASSGSNSLGSPGADGAGVAFADGQTAWLPGDLSPSLLRSLITPAGSEPIQRDNYHWQLE